MWFLENRSSDIHERASSARPHNDSHPFTNSFRQIGRRMKTRPLQGFFSFLWHNERERANRKAEYMLDSRMELSRLWYWKPANWINLYNRRELIQSHFWLISCNKKRKKNCNKKRKKKGVCQSSCGKNHSSEKYRSFSPYHKKIC